MDLSKSLPSSQIFGSVITPVGSIRRKHHYREVRSAGVSRVWPVDTTTTYSFLPGVPFTNYYVYDANSNRTMLTLPDGCNDTYIYDTLNRLTTSVLCAWYVIPIVAAALQRTISGKNLACDAGTIAKEARSRDSHTYVAGRRSLFPFRNVNAPYEQPHGQ